MGDDKRRRVPLSGRTESITLLTASGVTFASFNLSSEQVPADFLRVFYQATERKVVYGPSGKKKIKIGRANTKNIEKMLALYDASESLRLQSVVVQRFLGSYAPSPTR